MDMHKHPRALYLILFFEFIIRFTSWGLISTFVLYGINQLSKNFHLLYLMQGTFMAMSFALTPIGGYFADHIFGFKRSLQLGFLLLILGATSLGLMSNEYAYVGFSLLAFGLGLTISNNPSYLGLFYENEDGRKASAFTFLFSATNLGGLVGPIIYGYLSEFLKWNTVFFLNAIFLTIAFGSLFIFKNTLQAEEKPIKFNMGLLATILFSFGLFFILMWLFKMPSITFLFLLIVFLVMMGYLYKKLKNQNDSVKFYNIFAMMVFCILFFASEFQVNSSLITFADKYVNREFFSTQLPASAFSSIEPFFVVLMAPCVAFFVQLLFVRSSKRTIFVKIAMSFLLEGLGFLLIHYAAVLAQNGNLVSLYWLLFAYLLIGLGELLLMPCVISAISSTIPSALRGLGMGCLYSSIAMSGYLSGMVASFTEVLVGHTTSINYSSIYYDLALLSGCCALIVAVVALAIKHMPNTSSYVKE